MPDNYRLMVEADGGGDVAGRMFGWAMLPRFANHCRARGQRPAAFFEDPVPVGLLGSIEAAVVS